MSNIVTSRTNKHPTSSRIPVAVPPTHISSWREWARILKTRGIGHGSSTDDRRWCEAAQRDFQRVEESVSSPVQWRRHTLSRLRLATSFFTHNADSPSMGSQPYAPHQVSLPHGLPPSFPTRPGPLTLIDSHLEGSMAAELHAPLWTGEKSTDQRTSCAQHPATTVD